VLGAGWPQPRRRGSSGGGGGGGGAGLGGPWRVLGEGRALQRPRVGGNRAFRPSWEGWGKGLNLSAAFCVYLSLV